jgi:chromosome segregation ATPase
MNTTNVLEQLHDLDASLSRVEEAINSLNQRLIHLELGRAAIVQDIALLASTSAQKQHSLAALNERLDRIELRLPMASASATALAPRATRM